MDATTVSTLIDVSGVNFMDVLNEIVALIPTVLPVIIGCLGVRKGIAFIQSALRGA